MRAQPAARLSLLFGLAATGATFAMTASPARTQADQPATHPALTPRTKHVLGSSVDHRPIVAWLLAPRHALRSVLIVGSIAGDEPGGIAVTRLLAEQAAVAGVRLWLIPDVNPDGAVHGTRDNAHGVDLNRNFPWRWRHLDETRSRYYPGPRPSSEPETRAIEAFIRRVRPQLSIWLHQPYSLIDDSEGPHWAERYLARAIGLPLRRLPDYPGSAIGWDDHIVPSSAFDVELPGGQLSRATIHRVTTGIRALASALARQGSAQSRIAASR